MKLVELLAREITEWPKDGYKVKYWTQDSDGWIASWEDDGPLIFTGDHWKIADSCPVDQLTREKLAEDYKESVVTKDQWQAERDRQNGGEWKRHRGGKRPISCASLVDVKRRNGDIMQCRAGILEWKHSRKGDDVMQYKVISQPQAEEIEVIEPISTYKEFEVTGQWHQIDGPIKWRDRIVELEAHEEDIQREIASLHKRLTDEGFQLVRQYPSVSADVPGSLSYAEWIDGDIVRCVARDLSCADLTIGKEYTVVTRHGETGVIDDEEDHMCSCLEVGELEFIRRP